MRVTSMIFGLVFSTSIAALAYPGMSSQSTVKKADLDAEVTDPKMRADSGSKSKYSASFRLSYDGASLKKPFSDERPNVANSRNQEDVNMKGSVGLRYRFNKNESVFVATGMSKTRPFENREEDEFEVSTPMAHYNRTFAYKEMQMSSTMMGYYHTLDYLKRIHNVATFAYDISALKAIGQSRVQAGLSLSPYYNFYDGDQMKVPAGPMGMINVNIQSRQEDYGINLSPTLQVRVTDNFNVYTMLTAISYSHYRSESNDKWEKNPLTQKVGLGYAVMRDVYLSPSLFFQPKDIRDETVAVNLSASVNLF